VVLRLLYTNPFINRQELRDALWESVRCNRLEILRSLLEFRVDPSSAPSSSLSQAPASLRHVPWTPLLALAVNGAGRAEDRAELVAELLRADASKEAGKQRSKPPSPTLEIPVASSYTHETEPTGQSKRCVGRGGGDVVGMPKPTRNDRDLVASLLDEADKSSRDTKESRQPSDRIRDRLGQLGSEDLASVETELESLLRAVRCQRQQRLEQQLQSVQRRHEQESRGRQELEEGQICVVCSESEKTILFMPCRHLCTCVVSAAQLNLCPICRAEIAEKVRCIRP